MKLVINRARHPGVYAEKDVFGPIPRLGEYVTPLEGYCAFPVTSVNYGYEGGGNYTVVEINTVFSEEDWETFCDDAEADDWIVHRGKS